LRRKNTNNDEEVEEEKGRGAAEVEGPTVSLRRNEAMRLPCSFHKEELAR
jgi:hypothetical protein